MYKRMSAIAFPILLIALFGTGVWGYMEHRDKNSILVKAETAYQRAFHDLSFHVDKLHTELGNTLALNTDSHSSYRKGLTNAWRITSEAQNEVNQLPLSLMPFHRTEEFLANTANFAYRAAMRDLGKQPLTQDELGTLNALYKHSAEISADLRDMQAKVLQNNLRWMDVETALATHREPLDNTIIDGFQTVDKKVAEYADVRWSPSLLNAYQTRNMSSLSGKDVTPEEVRQKSAQFLGIQDPAQIQVVESGADTDYRVYTVTAPKANAPDGAQMDYSSKGGQLLWFSADRGVGNRQLDLRQARDKAAEFLDTHGYKNMTAISYDEYGNAVNITFATRNNDVINYLEKMAVRVAMDNGEVLGLQANDYVFEHKDRQFKEPAINVADARKVLNSNFQVQREQVALIRNDVDEEVLCHEFTGRINGGMYRIYINTETGTEEKVERLRELEQQIDQTAVDG
ncbi:germination protein YpeB [Paenibacillus xerothermodurans]|uniref:Germination protein YpeB n=1 Tax=Paenibacillus xerothermodurans TaxID=1977292 RepID=A0A2W1NEB8_PAEXE|nr:germination protein YpeB [Paenibacillus xerothermodurans]PZE21970.1 germination protein YpeB [Paenibacillus xerothermodurans]